MAAWIGCCVNGELTMKRSGWYAALLAEYKLESYTPGLLFWYSSGDDANAYNGSSVTSIDPDVYVTSTASTARTTAARAWTIDCSIIRYVWSWAA